MKHVAQRAIIQNHDPAQIRLDGAEVLDEGAMAEGAVLAVVAGREVLALGLEPVDDGVGVLLHRRREDNQVEPLADAPQELVAVGALVHVVQDRVLRPGRRRRALVCRVEPHLDHVPGAHAPALGHAVDQRLVEVEDQRLLVADVGGQFYVLVDVRGLPAGY